MSSGRDLLVVEEDGRLRDVLAVAAREMGFEATVAAGAQAALALLERRFFDIVLLDLDLSGMSGIELLKQVRQRKDAPEVVVLASSGDVAVARQMIRLRVADLLTKPLAMGNLESALDRARRRRVKQGAGTLPQRAWKDPSRSARPTTPLPAPGEPLSLEELERRHILAVLQNCRGNRQAAAAEMGISIRKLYYRLKKYQRQGFEF